VRLPKPTSLPAPPGPFRRATWRSPLRGPWLTSVLGFTLLGALTVIVITGFASHAAYQPELGANNLGRTPGALDFYLFGWPTSPSWLYAASQGLHVTIGVAATPILLAKLWSVIPKLFEWPPVRSLAHGLERLSLALLVGGALFEFVTGIFNIQLYYAWKFSFLSAHYYGAWVFTAAFLFHLVIKLPVAFRAVRHRRLRDELGIDLAHTRPETEADARAASGPTTEPSVTVPIEPAAPTLSRRGLLGLVGGGSALLLLTTAGQAIGGPFRRLALLAPHNRETGPGPNGFQVNKSAKAAGIEPGATGPAWRLELRAGGRTLMLSRANLLALPQRTHSLPIACVEGWSTTQSWTGVRISELAAMVGAGEDATVLVESLQKGGSFSRATLGAAQIRDDRSMLALRVNGVDLNLDHGFPARVIVPALPGVHNTKWVKKLSFGAPA